MGSNVFDGYAANVFDTTAQVMGYDATWTPSTGGAQQAARVLYNSPTEKRHMMHEAEYEPHNYTMEYKDKDFTTLKTLVDQGTEAEIVNVNGQDFNVRSVTAKFDGKTMLATLEPIES